MQPIRELLSKIASKPTDEGLLDRPVWRYAAPDARRWNMEYECKVVDISVRCLMVMAMEEMDRLADVNRNSERLTEKLKDELRQEREATRRLIRRF